LWQGKPETLYHKIEVDPKIDVGDEKGHPAKGHEVERGGPMARINGPLDK
jgi:hypothetical protein